MKANKNTFESKQSNDLILGFTVIWVKGLLLMTE